MAVQISGNDITVPRDGSFTRNVTIGGTLTYEDVTNIDSVGLVTARTGIEIGARPGVAASISVDGIMIISGISTFGDDITFTGATSGRDVVFDTSLNQMRAQDNAKLCAGTSSDLEIYHNATNSYVDNYTGHIYVRNNVSSDNGGNIYLQAKSGEDGVIVHDDGPVELYYDNTRVFETDSDSVKIRDNIKAKFGTGDDLQLWHNATHSNIKNSTGRLYILSDDIWIKDKDDGDLHAKFVHDGSVELYYDNVRKFRTVSDGVEVNAAEGGSANLALIADEGDDNADYWRLSGSTDGSLYIQNYTSGSWEKNLKATGNAGVDLYYDNSKKLEVTNTGITVTGSVSVTTEPAFRTGLIAANTAVTHNNNYTVPFDTDSGDGCFDTNGCFDTSTHRFTPTLAGYYYLHFQIRVDLGSADHLFQARIKHSSGEYIVINEIFNKSANNNGSNSCSCIQYFNGSSDYVNAEFYQNSGSTINIYGGTTYHYQTFFEGHFVRSA